MSNRIPPQGGSGTAPAQNGVEKPTFPTADERAQACLQEINRALERHVCRFVVRVQEIDGVRQPPEVVIVSR